MAFVKNPFLPFNEASESACHSDGRTCVAIKLSDPWVELRKWARAEREPRRENDLEKREPGKDAQTGEAHSAGTGNRLPPSNPPSLPPGVNKPLLRKQQPGLLRELNGKLPVSPELRKQ